MLPSAIWLIALIVLMMGEAVTVGLTFIWFAVGALGGLITTVLGGEIWLQIVVFFVLSGLSLALVRPLASRFLKTSHAPTNADRVIGKTAVVTEAVDNVAGKGQVNVSGQVWSARSEHDVVISVGTEVKVLRIEGVKVFVETV
ncbi:MAG: NfeD family protein [Lawsonibacter sp.]|nr:NfeD family protein [Lawsonibacter sp.]